MHALHASGACLAVGDRFKDSTLLHFHKMLTKHKYRLLSLDLFRCESAIVRTYWVVVVMDQLRDGSSGLPFTAALWMKSHYAGCSIALFLSS